MKVLITGANGFVGKALLLRLIGMSGVIPIGSVRSEAMISDGCEHLVCAGELSAQTDWSQALAEAKVVVHTAARVHVMGDTSADPLIEFRRINVDGTLNLARQAASVGVSRLVFVSSIKVNGEATSLGHPFTADDVPAPIDAYGVSKMEAEHGLREISQQTGMEVVIIRPPLVYGPGAKANFNLMIRWLKLGVPLPLGAIHNLRSLVSLENLVDLIVSCITLPSAANQTFLVSDDEDVSTTDLLRRMSQAMGSPIRLIPVPVSWLKLAAALVGKDDVAQRLCGSLQVDIKETKRILGWCPPLSLNQGLKKAAGIFG